jgi:hypothetical protein
MTAVTGPATDTAVAGLITFLETNQAPEGLFAADCFGDISYPQWRLQATNRREVVAIRLDGHETPGQVRVERVDRTERGFVLQFEERWQAEGQQWYCREMIRADVVDDTIVEMAVYCTGDWDEAKQREHARAVVLARP